MKAIVSRDGWILCPIHWTKLCRLDKGGRAIGVKLWCSRCRAEIELDTESGRE